MSEGLHGKVSILSSQFFCKPKKILLIKTKSHWLGRSPVCLFITISPFDGRVFHVKSHISHISPRMVLLPCDHQLPTSEVLRLIVEDTVFLFLLNLLHWVYHYILLFPHLSLPLSRISGLLNLYNYCYRLGALITPSLCCSDSLFLSFISPPF